MCALSKVEGARMVCLGIVHHDKILPTKAVLLLFVNRVTYNIYTTQIFFISLFVLGGSLSISAVECKR